MISGWLVVLRQGLILLVLGAGYAGWLWRFFGPRERQRTQAKTWLWFGLAGFCVSALLLQSLVYLGVPLRLTAWPAFAIGVAGLALAVHGGVNRTIIFSHEARLYALVFAGGFLGQAPGLLVLGPARYFGSGHYDQINYVVTAEFLRNEPFATPGENLGYRPWLLKPLETKAQRITQCVLLGALAEIDRSSAQEAYGTLSIFFVALMGAATTAWLRSSGLPRSAAGWAGLGAALTPALTRIHLDGFFSQTATLFVYPALAGLVGGRDGLTRGGKLCAAVLLAFLIGSYSEVAVFGLTLTAALVLAHGRPWRQRVFDLAAIFAGALVLNLGYLRRLPDFLIEQFTYASKPSALSDLFPESGTWLGWGRMFVDLTRPELVVSAGVIVAGLGLWSTVPARSHARAWRWIITLGVVLLPLLFLRATGHFPSYPFAKLTMHFVPLWMGAAMAGLVKLVGIRPRSRKLIWACGCLGTATACATALPLHLAIVRPAGRLAVLSSDALLRARREAEANPQRGYLVVHRDPLIAQWLCYFGRKNQTVFERRLLGDHLVPTETYAFRRWSPEIGDLWWLDPDLNGRVADYEPPPTLAVEGAAEMGGTDLGKYYTVTDSVDFVFTRKPGSQPMRFVWLDFVVVPVLPDQTHELVLENPPYSKQHTTVHTAGWQRWLIAVPQGESRCRLRLTSPRNSAGDGAKVLLELMSVEVALDVLPSDPKPVAVSGGP